MSQLPWREPQQLAAALQQRYGHQGLVWLDGDGTAAAMPCWRLVPASRCAAMAYRATPVPATRLQPCKSFRPRAWALARLAQL